MLLAWKDEETMEYSNLSFGRASWDLEWSILASKKMMKWNGRGVGRERICSRRGLLRWITPEGDWDWRVVSFERMEFVVGRDAEWGASTCRMMRTAADVPPAVWRREIAIGSTWMY